MAELLENIGHNVRRLREEKGWNQTELGFHADTSPSIISLIENGKRNPSTATLAKIARALGVEVVDLFPKAGRRSSRELSLFNGLEDERRVSRFAEAITTAAEEWGEAVSSADMDDSRRLTLVDAALRLSDLIGQSVEEQEWDAIPNRERREIITTMEKLSAVSERGLQHLEEKTEAHKQEEQIKHRREQIREWTRRIA